MLVEFHCSQNVEGLLAVGTTGESATLSWEEHLKVVDRVAEFAGSKCKVVAGTGSNSTEECLAATRHVVDAGIRSVLLVDPYYNGPSSLEIRREYYEPVAREFPDLEILPYIIPGRTGTMLSPEDLAILASEHENVVGVKDAIADLTKSRTIRKLCPEGFSIVCGDDERVLEMMCDPGIRATSTMSVMANVVPGCVQALVESALRRRFDEARNLFNQLLPLFRSVTVTTVESTPYGPVQNKARNPLPVKTLMSILGMPGGPCRRPLGKTTKAALRQLVDVARNLHESTEALRPVEDFFGIDLGERLYDERSWEGLAYDSY